MISRDTSDLLRAASRTVRRREMGGRRAFHVMAGVLSDFTEKLIATNQIRDEFTRRFEMTDEQIEERRAELRAAKERSP